MTMRELPKRDDLVDYGLAVAGHAGTMSDESGLLFIKPCTQNEIDFYQTAVEEYPEISEIVPVFMGTLTLKDPCEASTGEDDLLAIKQVMAQETTNAEKSPSQSQSPASTNGEETKDNVTWVPNKDKRIKTDHAVVLENSTHGFKKPNILDAKLGVRLWADDAPMQKRQRFDAISAETTHAKYGCRIAGMRVYKGSEDPAELDEDGYRIYDREYGRTTVNTGNFVEAVRKFIFNKAAGVDKALGKAVCQAFAHDLARVEDVLSTHETRMFSSSILFVFEGDGAALEDAIQKNNDLAEELEKSVPTNLRVDSGIGMDFDEIKDGAPRPGVSGDGVRAIFGHNKTGGNNVQEDDSEDDDSTVKLPKIYSLKLIDFAHAKYTPGQGPDENTLVGIRSLRRIFEELAE